ncbi:MAG: ABC transporter ATP-binding protein [Planctomycetes bacterium]|nr:ABC transporter ATP-binding protein [Planctomycetota bacterium]
MPDPSHPLLTIADLKVSFFLDEGTVHAVEGVDLAVPRGTTLGLVGESGCGKSVTALAILRLISPPGRIVGGRVVLHRPDADVVLTDLKADGEAIRRIRGKEIAMIFQEPMTSLSPVHTVGNQIREAITLHTPRRGAEAREQAVEVLRHVGIPDPARRYRQYPHEMSGGMRQRAMIAMALSCRPSLLIADEPTTALDATIQAQILDLMRRLQAELGMSILLITHDLGVVAEMASQVAVMYWGRIVEQAPTEAIYADPQHPYTRALLRSIPGRGTRRKARLQVIAGSVPDPFEHLPGCPFHPRCDEARPGVCDAGEPPPLHEVRPGHLVACFRRNPTTEGTECPSRQAATKRRCGE